MAGPSLSRLVNEMSWPFWSGSVNSGAFCSGSSMGRILRANRLPGPASLLESRAFRVQDPGFAQVWGRSSAGRASRSQCEGRGFDPLRLHHSTPALLGLLTAAEAAELDLALAQVLLEAAHDAEDRLAEPLDLPRLDPVDLLERRDRLRPALRDPQKD